MIKQQPFDQLDFERFAWLCIEPAFELVRGKSPDVKHAVYEALTVGQQALFSFWALHGHSESLDSFRSILRYLIDLGSVAQVKSAALLFGCDELVEVYEESFALTQAISSSGCGATPLQDREMQRLFDRYHAIAPLALEAIAHYIRSYPSQFVRPAGD